MGHTWIILVVFVLIWILNNFLRGNEDERKARGGGGGGRSSQGRTGKASAEIDRFLEEVNRRRRQNVERRQSAPAPQPAPVATQSTRPAPGSLRSSPRRPKVGSQSTRKAEELVEAVLVAEAAPATEPSPYDSPAYAEPPAPSQPSSSPKVEDREQSKTLVHLLSLMKSPEGLRNAVLLREVLGEPACRRHGRRSSLQDFIGSLRLMPPSPGSRNTASMKSAVNLLL